MHLSGCILIVGMTILGMSSVTIKHTGKGLCLEGEGEYSIRLAKCVPNSPFQNWIVDGDRIKNEKLGRCLSTTMKIDKLLLRCEVEENSHKSNAIANRKMRIEGNEVKNYYNDCLYFGIVNMYWAKCERKYKENEKAIVE
jgi:hypothetical protein